MFKAIKPALLLGLLSFFSIPTEAAVSEEYKASVRASLVDQIANNAPLVKKSYQTTDRSYFHDKDYPLEIDTLGPSVGEVVGV